MKAIKHILVAMAILFSAIGFSQHRAGHRHAHHGKRVVVKRSVYRPHKAIVYRPVWGRHYTCSRRWVYFPKYNLYWDNWRGHYLFWNGTIWLSQEARPRVIEKVDLETEKRAELSEEEDDVDDIYKTNTNHQSKYSGS